jgi:hypothetical protein
MKFRLIMPGLLVLVFLLAACSTPELRDTRMLQDDSIITGDPCLAPCWRGITPGETPWRDAVTILEDDTTIENLQTQTDEATGAAAAEWQQQGGTACCQAFSSDGETVSILFLRTAPGVTLGEVIDTYGEPSYAIGSPFSDNQAIVNLIYPDLPMVIYAFIPGTNGSVTAEADIIGMLYLTQEEMDLLEVTSNLHIWEGYDTYTAYRGEEDATFDITPSVTLTPTPTNAP